MIYETVWDIMKYVAHLTKAPDRQTYRHTRGV